MLQEPIGLDVALAPWELRGGRQDDQPFWEERRPFSGAKTR